MNTKDMLDTVDFHINQYKLYGECGSPWAIRRIDIFKDIRKLIVAFEKWQKTVGVLEDKLNHIENMWNYRDEVESFLTEVRVLGEEE